MGGSVCVRNESLNKHQHFLSLLPIGVAAISIFLSSNATATTLTTGETTNDVILWNNAALQAIRDTASAPPVVARGLAIVHTGIFDAWAAYDSVAVDTQLGDSLRRPEEERTLDNKNKAISYAAYRTLVDLFPTEVSLFDNVMTSLGYTTTDTSTDITTPTGIGNVAAKALLDFRHQDGSNQLGDLHPGAYSDYTNYTPINTSDTLNDPNRWQPLPGQKFVTPQWGQVTPFALESGSQLRPTVGPKTTTADPEGYQKQAKDLLDISANLTDRQKVIAEYWSDGPGSETPPGQWNLFAQFVSQRDGHDLDTDVKMFFTLDNALLDASIAVWDTKKAYDSERPVTAIRYLFDPTWQSYIPTPAFPEYVSGHSTFSATAAEILKRFTGSDDFGASYTRAAGVSFLPGKPGPATDITLSWDTFSDAADEAGISRRYGGIHFEDGDLVGRDLGRKVGTLVWDKAQNYISPKSVSEPSSILGTLVVGVLGAGALLKRRIEFLSSR